MKCTRRTICHFNLALDGGRERGGCCRLSSIDPPLTWGRHPKDAPVSPRVNPAWRANRVHHAAINPVFVPPSHRRSSNWTSLRRLPILYKVLIANAAIVMLGAIGGTWLTVEIMTPLSAPHGRSVPLMLGFVLLGIVLSIVANYVVLRAAFQPIINLARAADAVRSGDFTARAAPTTFDDPQIARLSEAFNDTLDELARDRSELRSLASKVIHAQEEERKRISRELHDDTAQILFAQLMRIAALKSSTTGSLSVAVASLEQMTADALEGVRRLALELRPPALDDLGLVAALGELVQRYSESLGISVDYRPQGSRGRLPADIELVLYRVAQEALTNIQKHAHAKHVYVDLDRGADDVSLSIRDDGDGFDIDAARPGDQPGLGLGLFGMEERVGLVGGTFRIWTRPMGGSEIFAFVPLVTAHSSGNRGPTYAG